MSLRRRADVRFASRATTGGCSRPKYTPYLRLVAPRPASVPRIVTLQPPRFGLDEAALAEAFSPRTKAVLFCNPLNPTATRFSDADLALLARFCVENDAIALCDEVWEHIVFDGARHRPLIAQAGMRERTVKIGSAGKIFNLTGWKVGFVCAAPELLGTLAKAHQFLTFTTPPNLQSAVAYGLAKEDAFFEGLRADLQRSRDRFAAGLAALGFRRDPGGGDLLPQHRHRRSRRGRRELLPAARHRPRRRRDPGLRLLPGRRGDERRALLLRQEGRDAGYGAGADARRLLTSRARPTRPASLRPPSVVTGGERRGLSCD